MRGMLAWICLTAYCGILFFSGLGDRDLTSSHEARAAQNAQTILQEGHWLVPRLFDRHLELQKPPLYYWLVAIFGWLGGGQVDVWTVRLPAALSALACVWFVHYLGRRCNRPLAGLLAAFILASCVHFTWLARVGRIDMPLTLSITVALGAFHLGNMGTNRVRWHALGYAMLGMGLLLKGPIAVVLPAAVAASVGLFHRLLLPAAAAQPGPISTHHSPLATLYWGVPFMLAIAAPWYVWANIQTGNGLWEVFFWYHNVERGLGSAEALKSHPWWFYGPQAALDLLPWSLAVPFAVWRLVRDGSLRKNAAAWLGLCWFFSIALFLTCVSFKRADYLLPAYPGLAIFLGICGERWWQSHAELEASAKRYTKSPRLAVACFLSILALVAVGWGVHHSWLVPSEEKSWPYQAMAAEIRQRTSGPVIFFRAESHPLMFRVGKPVDTILEWENLEWWANRPAPVYFVMPVSCAAEWRDHLATGSLEEVLRSTSYTGGKRDRPLVVLRSAGQRNASR